MGCKQGCVKKNGLLKDYTLSDVRGRWGREEVRNVFNRPLGKTEDLGTKDTRGSVCPGGLGKVTIKIVFRISNMLCSGKLRK